MLLRIGMPDGRGSREAAGVLQTPDHKMVPYMQEVG